MVFSCRTIVCQPDGDPDERPGGALTRASTQLHLAFCGDCCRYLRQVKAVRAALGALGPERVAAATKGLLMERFRAWHAALAKAGS